MHALADKLTHGDMLLGYAFIITVMLFESHQIQEQEINLGGFTVTSQWKSTTSHPTTPPHRLPTPIPRFNILLIS